MKLKLLVINDSSNEKERISQLLGAYFPEIILYNQTNNSDAVSKIKGILPNIIIIYLDNSNDIDHNLQFLKNVAQTSKGIIIVISDISDLNLIYQAGATNFIQKPYSDVTFISNIKSAVNLISVLQSVRDHEVEIEKKNLEIKTQIENELVQKEIISKKNKEMMADIRYASRIQQAILPNLELLNNNMEEYFILHQPKSHVSGDFYWFSVHEDKQIIAVGDCTGHGLSGALMHMLGSVYLNEIISKGNLNSASYILNQLRDHIMRSLNQKGESGETQDGLDIALCILDNKTRTMQFAGANNPVYIINNNELNEVKGDRMPVGIHINFDKPFTNHCIDLKKGDQVYLFSDGYADQFGGPRGKKFRYKQFKELLINISHEPMNIQKEILNNTHDKWRGSVEQIDDILVFGIKIK